MERPRPRVKGEGCKQRKRRPWRKTGVFLDAPPQDLIWSLKAVRETKSEEAAKNTPVFLHGRRRSNNRGTPPP